MTNTDWIKFDRKDPESFPSQDRDLVVETERGQTFPASFIAKSCDFSLKWVLWGNQGAVVRWRYANNNRLSERRQAPQFGHPSTGVS